MRFPVSFHSQKLGNLKSPKEEHVPEELLAALETLDNVKGRKKGNLVILVKGRDRLSREIFGNEKVLFIFYIFILSLKK